MDVSIEYILFLVEERKKINRVPLDEIDFYHYGNKLDIGKNIISEFEFIGLSNIDFITSGFYEHGWDKKEDK